MFPRATVFPGPGSWQQWNNRTDDCFISFWQLYATLQNQFSVRDVIFVHWNQSWVLPTSSETEQQMLNHGPFPRISTETTVSHMVPVSCPGLARAMAAEPARRQRVADSCITKICNYIQYIGVLNTIKREVGLMEMPQWTKSLYCMLYLLTDDICWDKLSVVKMFCLIFVTHHKLANPWVRKVISSFSTQHLSSENLLWNFIKWIFCRGTWLLSSLKLESWRFLAITIQPVGTCFPFGIYTIHVWSVVWCSSLVLIYTYCFVSVGKMSLVFRCLFVFKWIQLQHYWLWKMKCTIRWNASGTPALKLLKCHLLGKTRQFLVHYFIVEDNVNQRLSEAFNCSVITTFISTFMKMQYILLIWNIYIDK